MLGTTGRCCFKVIFLPLMHFIQCMVGGDIEGVWELDWFVTGNGYRASLLS